ncbi:MAG: type II toxin-antitoxin system RelE/ParE family toxin [Thiolinea sp.]
MKWKAYQFSPLAEAQLDEIWDYSFSRFGEHQADRYLEGFFQLLGELIASGRCRGLRPRQVPRDKIADITDRIIYYVRYEHHYLYFHDLSDGELGVICILGERMDTPNRLRESLSGEM